MRRDLQNKFFSRLLAFGVAGAFFFAQLTAASHAHEDHDDDDLQLVCSICILVSQGDVADIPPVTSMPTASVLSATFAMEAFRIWLRQWTSFSIRAPPDAIQI